MGSLSLSGRSAAGQPGHDLSCHEAGQRGSRLEAIQQSGVGLFDGTDFLVRKEAHRPELRATHLQMTRIKRPHNAREVTDIA